MGFNSAFKGLRTIGAIPIYLHLADGDSFIYLILFYFTLLYFTLLYFTVTVLKSTLLLIVYCQLTAFFVASDIF